MKAEAVADTSAATSTATPGETPDTYNRGGQHSKAYLKYLQRLQVDVVLCDSLL